MRKVMGRRCWRIVPLEERFWEKVKKVGSCWEWQGALVQNCGYGRISNNYKNIYVHRYAYELLCGPIPDGLFVLHHCDNPMCVNPVHLFLGTHQDNMNDMKLKNRKATGENHWTHVKPAQVAKGEKCSKTKLSVAQVYEIREKYKPHQYGFHKLANEYGVSHQSIKYIIERKNWKHI